MMNKEIKKIIKAIEKNNMTSIVPAFGINNSTKVVRIKTMANKVKGITKISFIVTKNYSIVEVSENKQLCGIFIGADNVIINIPYLQIEKLIELL